MLDETSGSQSGFAWLRFGEWSRTLRIRSMNENPSAESCSFYAPDFARQMSHPWLVGELIDADWILNERPASWPAILNQHKPEVTDFYQLHAQILGQLDSGAFSKVVPIIYEDLEFSENLQSSMQGSRALLPGQYHYGFEFLGSGLAGVTPELLFSVKNNQLSTMALAGTGPAGGPSLLDDAKERSEHQMVIEHIVQELKAWGMADVGRTIERPFGALKHLYTPITLSLQRPPEFLDLVACLHPTAALGGWPKAPALRWLSAQKFHHERERFGAPFGFKDVSEMCCVVAIRCIQWTGRVGKLCVGCGVVKGSRADREWQELQLKRRATLEALGLEL